jgi:hypothetical protein
VVRVILSVYFASTLAFYGLGRAGQHTYNGDFFSYEGALTITSWSMYGWMDPSRLEQPVAMVCLFWYVMLTHVALMK